MCVRLTAVLKMLIQIYCRCLLLLKRDPSFRHLHHILSQCWRWLLPPSAPTIPHTPHIRASRCYEPSVNSETTFGKKRHAWSVWLSVNEAVQRYLRCFSSHYTLSSALCVLARAAFPRSSLDLVSAKWSPSFVFDVVPLSHEFGPITPQVFFRGACFFKEQVLRSACLTASQRSRLARIVILPT